MNGFLLLEQRLSRRLVSVNSNLSDLGIFFVNQVL